MQTRMVKIDCDISYTDSKKSLQILNFLLILVDY